MTERLAILYGCRPVMLPTSNSAACRWKIVDLIVISQVGSREGTHDSCTEVCVNDVNPADVSSTKYGNMSLNAQLIATIAGVSDSDLDKRGYKYN